MWWLLIPVAVGAAALIASYISEEEKTARIRWENKRSEVERTIEEHQRNIERHISAAQTSFDFYFLVDLHYSSVKVADSAYSLLSDARTSLKAISRILNNIDSKKKEIKSLLSTAKGVEKTELLTEIRSLNEFKSTTLQDLNKVKNQQNSLLEKVREFNIQTANLKKSIRDRCGQKGFDWFQRLEERKRQRNSKHS